MKTLVLGGVRSGKSRLASRLAMGTGKPVVYVATARVLDEETRARVESHKASRPAHWEVIEEPLELAPVLRRYAAEDTVMLVDCLTMWLTNLLEDSDSDLSPARDELYRTVSGCAADLVLVSNETNMGVIPAGELSRRFCDEAGLLHQQLAGCCDSVILTVAGLPHTLKSPP